MTLLRFLLPREAPRGGAAVGERLIVMMCSVPLHELLTELVAELVLSCSASTMSPGLSSLPLPSLTPPPSNLNHVFHLLVPPYFPAINQLPVPPRHLAAAAPGPPCPLRGPGFILLSNKPLSHCLKSYLASHYLYFPLYLYTKAWNPYATSALFSNSKNTPFSH